MIHVYAGLDSDKLFTPSSITNVEFRGSPKKERMQLATHYEGAHSQSPIILDV